jgi:hypothetical protein
MYIQRREMYDWGWRPPNGWHLIPFGLLLFLYIYISIPAFNWCWACWILLSPDGSHFKQQDQDGRPASSMKEWQLNPASSMKEWQLNRSAYTRGHTTADADGQHIGSWTRPAAAAVIQWLCRVFICFLLLFLFFLCVFLFLFPCCWWSSLEGTGNKSSAKKINQWLYSIGFVFQFLLFWAVASHMCVCIYSRPSSSQKGMPYVCVYTFFFFFRPSRAVGCGTCCSRPLVILLLFWKEFRLFPLSTLSSASCAAWDVERGPPLLLGCLIASKSSRPV